MPYAEMHGLEMERVEDYLAEVLRLLLMRTRMRKFTMIRFT